MNIKGKEKQILPDLKIGDEKILSKFKVNFKFRNLKDWFVGLTIRF